MDDLEVDYTVNLTAAFTFDCTGEFTDTQTSIDGGYALSPDPVDPEIVDVNQSSPWTAASTI